ncbi:GNAT family N-acetyltransferase [Shewanella sp. NIFS-20-20]|uniref:GNAT family N-acetyltransferase n=1 Tax=Shewanella sp. NIFS-20-20 TaxID=2853806 RepID=UPI00352705F6
MKPSTIARLPSGANGELALSVHEHQDITAIDACDWDRLMDDAGLANPFNCHGFLSLLERSGAVGNHSGWRSCHWSVELDGRVVAVMPLYIKAHSYGEYVFDFSWAQAYKQQGLDYYPKLLTAIPFTPISGTRLGLCSRLDSQQKSQVLDIVMATIASRLTRGVSSWHALGIPESQAMSWQQRYSGVMRQTAQFHWFNDQYADFDDFLARLTAGKRKTIRKERRQIASYGLSFRFLTADAIEPQHWQGFYACYQHTYLKLSGHQGYLPWAFFEGLGQLSLEVMLLVAEDSDKAMVASALYFRDEETLYGRYWGCLQELPLLHFEMCLYQGMDYCIEQRLACFNAGAQGEHKLLRGFEPVLMYSYHRLETSILSAAITRYCHDERQQVDHYVAQARLCLPYKEAGNHRA